MKTLKTRKRSQYWNVVISLIVLFSTTLVISLLIFNAGCSSDGDDVTPTETPPNKDNNESAKLMDDVPPISGAVFRCENNCGAGIHQYHTTTGSAIEITNAYKTALTGKGWTIISSGGAGNGAGLSATKGPKYLEFHVGGDSGGTMNIDLEVWPVEPFDKDCSYCKVTNKGGDNQGSDGEKNKDEDTGGGSGSGDTSSDLMGDLPAKPDNYQYQCENNCGDGLHRYYTTSGDALAIARDYENRLKNAGWTIVVQVGGVAQGAGLEAQKGNKYLDYDVGGQSTTLMNVDISVWPSEPSNKNCENCEITGGGNDAGKPTDKDDTGETGSLWEDIPHVYGLKPNVEEKCGDGEHRWYTTGSSPTVVIEDFMKAMSDNGWAINTIDSPGPGGGKFEATKAPRYMIMNMGGWNTFHIDVCVWPLKPSNTNCGQDCDDD